MAKTHIEADELENALVILIDEYEREVDDKFKKDLVKSAGVIVDELKSAEPAGAGRYHDWSEYNSGWKKSVEDDTLLYKVVVHNAKKPGLTHLLEKGHLTRDGYTMAKAFPHIAPAAEKGMKDLERRLNNGS